MLRRIGLSLCLMVSMVVMIPLITSTAHNMRAHFASRSAHHRRHSRAWWRRRRALMRRRQAMLARRRALIAARRSGQAPAVVPEKTAENHRVLSTAVTVPATPASSNTANSNALPLPNGWSQASSTNGASNFRIAPAPGAEAHATLAVIAPATGNKPFGREQRNMVGGASYTELRRTVIDRMISAGGWVVNDRQREIGGRRVFEVIAQTPSTNGKPDQIWNFYFTEVNGRVYSLTTRSAGASDKVAADAEKFLGSFSPVEQSKRK
ncbi:MAG TPA: hypothetical protein VJT71_12850 [Pyrinomonadaceae bacterium]|nr:hypothetical protein [Pyrinomonadaceae bacterium]